MMFASLGADVGSFTPNEKMPVIKVQETVLE
jgi:hypothetical protein